MSKREILEGRLEVTMLADDPNLSYWGLIEGYIKIDGEGYSAGNTIQYTQSDAHVYTVTLSGIITSLQRKIDEVYGPDAYQLKLTEDTRCLN